jgi:hypothetical protein
MVTMQISDLLEKKKILGSRQRQNKYRPPNYPKKPLNAFMLFNQKNREKVKQDMIVQYKDYITYGSDGKPKISIPMVDGFNNPKINSKTNKQEVWNVTKQLGQIWNSMTDPQKKPYTDEANELKKQYEDTLAQWKEDNPDEVKKMESKAPYVDGSITKGVHFPKGLLNKKPKKSSITVPMFAKVGVNKSITTPAPTSVSLPNIQQPQPGQREKITGNEVMAKLNKFTQ